MSKRINQLVGMGELVQPPAFSFCSAQLFDCGCQLACQGPQQKFVIQSKSVRSGAFGVDNPQYPVFEFDGHTKFRRGSLVHIKVILDTTYISDANRLTHLGNLPGDTLAKWNIGWN